MNWFWGAIELLATLTQSYIIVSFVNKFLGSKLSTKANRASMLIMWLIFAAATIMCNLITYFEGPAVIIFSILLFVYSLLCLSGSFLLKIIASVAPIFCIVGVSSLFLHTLPIVFSTSVYNIITEAGFPRLILLIITQLTLFYVLFFILKFAHEGKPQFTKSESFLVVFIFLISIVIFALIDLVAISIIPTETTSYLLALCIIGLAVINIATLYLMSQVSIKNAMRVQNQLLQQQLAYQEQYSGITHQQYQSSMQIRHDLKHIYSVINVHLLQGEYEKAKDMLGKYMQVELNALSNVKTNNETLNAIINVKLTYAKSINITTFCILPIEFDLLSDNEICSVFGNLLDNAIEYCEKHRDKQNEITVSVKWHNNQCVILITNSLHGSVIGTNASLTTSKGDQNTHGIGLRSVRQIVSKHDGLFSYYEQNSAFCVRIILFS